MAAKKYVLEKDGIVLETTIASEAVQHRAAGFKDVEPGDKKADKPTEGKPADSKTSK